MSAAHDLVSGSSGSNRTRPGTVVLEPRRLASGDLTYKGPVRRHYRSMRHARRFPLLFSL
jgi:hypothetical protein